MDIAIDNLVLRVAQPEQLGLFKNHPDLLKKQVYTIQSRVTEAEVRHFFKRVAGEKTNPLTEDMADGIHALSREFEYHGFDEELLKVSLLPEGSKAPIIERILELRKQVNGYDSDVQELQLRIKYILDGIGKVRESLGNMKERFAKQAEILKNIRDSEVELEQSRKDVEQVIPGESLERLQQKRNRADAFMLMADMQLDAKDRLDKARLSGMCSLQEFGDTPRAQDIFECTTCTDGTIGVRVCYRCAIACHQGHHLTPLGVCSAVCECGSQKKCVCHLTKMGCTRKLYKRDLGMQWGYRCETCSRDNICPLCMITCHQGHGHVIGACQPSKHHCGCQCRGHLC